jgi:hypothetical protein
MCQYKTAQNMIRRDFQVRAACVRAKRVAMNLLKLLQPLGLALYAIQANFAGLADRVIAAVYISHSDVDSKDWTIQ